MNLLTAAVILVAIIGVVCIVRILRMAPVPAFSRVSLLRSGVAALDLGRAWRVREAFPRFSWIFSVALVVGLVAASFIPAVSINAGVLAEPKAAREYLAVLWQVLAAAVGVSVALIALVLDAYREEGQRHFGGSLLDFARVTRVIVVFDFIAGSLAAAGVVLLRSDPSGWPAAYSSGLMLLALVGLLTVVPRALLRSLDSDRLMSLRIERARRASRRAITHQLLGQIGLQTIEREKEQTRVRRGLAIATSERVEARRAGTVADIYLGRLQRVIARLPSEASLEVLVDIGDPVQKTTNLIATNASLSRNQKRLLRRAFLVRNGDGPAGELDRTLRSLFAHSEQAVKAGDTDGWRRYAVVFNEILLELPRATRRWGIDFDGAVSRPGFWGVGPAGKILEHVLDAGVIAMRAEADELISAISYEPVSVAHEAARLKAPGLVAELANTEMWLYGRAVGGTASKASADRLARAAIDNQFEIAEQVGGNQLAFPTDDSISADEALENLSRVLAALQGMLKSAVDSRDKKGFEQIRRGLQNISQYWDRQFEPSPVGSAQRGVEARIDGLKLVILMWVLHRFEDSEGERNVEKAMASALLADLEPARSIPAFELVREDSRSLGQDWSFWFYDHEIGGAQSLEYDNNLARAFALTLVGEVIRAGTVQLTDIEWNEWTIEGVEQSLATMSATPDGTASAIADLVSPPDADPGAPGAPPDIPGAVATVMQAVDALKQEARDRDARLAREAIVDPAQVESFASTVLSEIRDRDALSAMFESVKGVIDRSDEDEPFYELGRWSSKGFFTGNPSYVGQDQMARNMAQSYILGQAQRLVELLKDSPVVPQGAELMESVSGAVREMVVGGLRPTLVILPSSWRARQELEVDGSPEAGGPEIPVVHMRAFEGYVAGIPAIKTRSLSTEIAVLDFAAFVKLLQRSGAEGAAAKPVVREFSADESNAYVKEHPGAIGEGQSEEQAALEIQASVLTKLEVYRQYELADSAAARRIQVAARILDPRPADEGN